jgi:hypothetical protein
VDVVECRYFLVREALGGEGNTDVVFDRRRGNRRVHNAHAGVRESYPGSEALFGKIFGRGKRGTLPRGPAAKIKRPDLMVKRHIKNGHNIKDED